LNWAPDSYAPTYSFNGAGNLILESKDSIKERGMKSPDIADAVMCTFAEVVVAKQHRHDEKLPHGAPAVAANARDYEVPWRRRHGRT